MFATKIAVSVVFFLIVLLVADAAVEKIFGEARPMLTNVVTWVIVMPVLLYMWRNRKSA